MDILEGHIVKLRSVMPNDAERFFQDSLDSHAQRFADETKLPFPMSNLIERIEKQKDRTTDSVWLAVVDKKTGELVGSTTTHNTEKRHGTFEYGIAIFAEHRRKGIAAETVALLLRFFFRELGYRRAMATVYEFNEPSLALHRSLGFTEEGRLRKSIFTNGEAHDEILFGMLAEEFAEAEKRLPEFPFKPG